MDPGYNPRTVEEVFRDYKGRRAGIIRALTTDVEDFFQQCDPEKENLCLYGFPNENWEVNLPAEEVPPELPEPALGVNFARDGMQEKDWLSMVAVHSDAWLLSVAFYFGARFGFDKNDRKRLFGMINELPTTFEVVNGKSKIKAPPTNNNNSNIKPKSNNKTKSSEPKVKQPKPPPPPQVKSEDPAPAEEGPAAEEEDGAAAVLARASTGRHSAGRAGRAMAPTSSGSAATSARSGSMASASRSRRPRPSTSSGTSVRPAPEAGAATAAASGLARNAVNLFN